MSGKPSLNENGHTAVLTLSRALSLDSAGKHDLTEQITALAGCDAIRALILHATNPAAFLVDLAELADMKPESAALFSRAGHALANALASLPFPAIAAVEGAALGGGCELILACDLVVAGSKATFGQIEAMGGVMPAFGGTWRLARRVGFQRASEMMFTAAVVSAETAKAYGLVLEVCPAGSALTVAQEIANRIIKASRASVAAIKRIANQGWNLPPSEIDLLEEAAFPQLFGEEQSTLMHAFLAQQQP